jgi:hypothetical protein
MTWFLVVAAVAVIFVVRLALRRQRRFPVSRSEAVSTLHMDMSRKHTKETRAALDAASSTLR